MLNLTSRAALAVLLAASCPASAADPHVRPEPAAEPAHGRHPGAAPANGVEGGLLFWRAYGWPGGQAGPCWRLWYGQWVWSC